MVSKYFDPSVPLDDESIQAHQESCSKDHDLCMCMVADDTVLVADEQGKGVLFCGKLKLTCFYSGLRKLNG